MVKKSTCRTEADPYRESFWCCAFRSRDVAVFYQTVSTTVRMFDADLMDLLGSETTFGQSVL